MKSIGNIWTAVGMIVAWLQRLGGIRVMIKQDLDISSEQIKYMKHAIGFNPVKVKNDKYFAWRNYFTTSDNDENWDMLVIQGLAIKNDFKLGGGPNPQVYQVSKKGFKFMEDVLNIRIIVDRR